MTAGGPGERNVAEVRFLAGDKARWISGYILTVEGGGMGRPPR